MSNYYEEEQEKLRRLWEEVESEEEPDDEEEELVFEENHVETRSTDSESEQECSDSSDDDVPLANLAKLARIPTFIGKDGTTRWHKHCPNKTVRTRRENIIVRLPGVRNCGKNAKTAVECWSLFFTDEMLNIIVENTNHYISGLAENYARERRGKPTDICEIKAFLGLLYLAGTLKSGRLNTKELWQRNELGIERFWLVLSHDRFHFLLRCLRFDDLTTRDERKKFDKLAPIRSLFDLFVEKCKNTYTVGVNTTIDEKLEAFRGRCSFKQYIPSKPNRYGIKIFALVDSATSYASNLEVYVGKQPEGPFEQSNKPHDIVLRLIEPISGTNRNLTSDNWFTSVELVKKLFDEHKITYVGTIKKNKRELPPEFSNTRARPEFSSVFGFQKDMTIVSYIPKKYRNVNLISSLHHDDRIDPSTAEKCKPDIITYYNHTKGGVDNLDKLSATYNVARNTRRWPMVIFFSMMNMAGVNSQIIFACNNKTYKIERRSFLRDIGLSLTKEHLARRSYETNVPRSVRERRQEVAGTQENMKNEEIQPGTRRRCFFCKKDSKTKYFCKKCKKFVCLSHMEAWCPECSEIDINQ